MNSKKVSFNVSFNVHFNLLSPSLSLSLLIGLGCPLFTLLLPAQAETSTVIAQAQSYSVLYVNSQTGNNAGNGRETAPFRTITHALTQANPNTIIKLAPGTYNQQSGEVFPLEMKPGVTLQGEISDRGQSIIIQGSGLFLSKTSARQQVALIGANRAGLQGVTVSNPSPQGYGLWVESSSPVVSDSTFTGNGHDGVSIVGNSAPILSNNYFYGNGANGVTIYGTSRPELKDNIFEKTGFGINIAQNSAPRIIGNRITQNKDGIVVQGNAAPVLRSNVIDGNDRDGLVAIGESRPDLGTTADQGNNIFSNNGNLDVNAQASRQVIPSAGNQLTRTAGRLDVNASFVAAVPQRVLVPVQAWIQNPVQTSAQTSAQTSVQTPVQMAITPTSATSSIQDANQELTFTRPGAEASTAIPIPVSKSSFAARTTTIPVFPIVTSMPTGLTPAFSTPSLPLMSASIPIAVQAGSGGGRSLPMPKQAVIKAPIPTSMTFNNWVLPTRGVAPVSQPSSPTNPPSNLAANTLPVPASSIPVGNVGDLSSVAVWRKSGKQPQAAVPRPLDSSSLRYRVIVEMADSDALRSIVPGAFTATANGRSVMQAGAFGDQGKANQLLQRLVNQGIQASMEQF